MIRVYSYEEVHQSPNKIPKGYIKYDTDWSCLKFIYCKWFLYPILKTYVTARHYKYKFYWFLNKKGIMHTRQGKIMELSDLWSR